MGCSAALVRGANRANPQAAVAAERGGRGPSNGLHLRRLPHVRSRATDCREQERIQWSIREAFLIPRLTNEAIQSDTEMGCAGKKRTFKIIRCSAER